MRLKYLLQHVDERDVDSETQLMSVSKFHGVIPRSDISDDEGRADDISNYKTCKPDDLVINRMAAYQGALGIAKQFGAISPDYMVLRINSGFVPRYLGYFFKSHWMHSQMSSLVKGIGSIESNSARTPRLSWNDLKNLDVSIPPLDEQKAIADFLDRELAQLDSVLSKFGQLVALIGEHRISQFDSLITNTDNEAGIENSDTWYVGRGDPLHKFFAEVNIRVGSKSAPVLFSVSQSRGVVPYSQISDKPPRADSFESYKEVQPGDLILNRFNAYRGALGVAEEYGMVSPDYAVLRPKGVDSKYFNYWFRTTQVTNAIKATMGGIGAGDPDSSGFSRINMKEVLNLKVHLDDEQARQVAARHLSAKLQSLAHLESEVRKCEASLRERRQSLISAAVTGKIDVRKVS